MEEDKKKIIGFTGSQNGMTPEQKVAVSALLRDLNKQGFGIFYHGDCVGADLQAAELATLIGYYTVAMPSNIKGKRAFHKSNKIMKPDRPIPRNHKIVDISNLMIATPKSNFNILRSGTWATIRYINKRRKHMIIVWPSGAMEQNS